MTSSLFDLQHLVDVKLKLAHKAVDPNEAQKVFVAAWEWLLEPVMEQRDRYAAPVKFTCIDHVIHSLIHIVKHVRMHLELESSTDDVAEL